MKDSRGRPFQPSAEPPLSSVPPWFLELYPNAFRGLTSNAMLIGATLEEAQDAAQAALTDLLDRVMRGTVIHHPYAYARTAMWRYFVSQRERDRKQIQNLIQRGYTSPEAQGFAKVGVTVSDWRGGVLACQRPGLRAAPRRC